MLTLQQGIALSGFVAGALAGLTAGCCAVTWLYMVRVRRARQGRLVGRDLPTALEFLALIGDSVQSAGCVLLFWILLYVAAGRGFGAEQYDLFQIWVATAASAWIVEPLLTAVAGGSRALRIRSGLMVTGGVGAICFTPAYSQHPVAGLVLVGLAACTVTAGLHMEETLVRTPRRGSDVYPSNSG